MSTPSDTNPDTTTTAVGAAALAPTSPAARSRGATSIALALALQRALTEARHVGLATGIAAALGARPGRSRI